MRISTAFGLLAFLLPVSAMAAPQSRAPLPSLVRQAGEGAKAFAGRILHVGSDDLHIVQSVWNGRPVIFADYPVMRKIAGSQDSEDDRDLVALEQMADGTYRKSFVTTGEEEGGEAQIAAIGFANADKDSAEELIVLLSWDVQHADVHGTLYEVRIFDDAGSEPPARLVYLQAVSKQFDRDTCDCDRTDGKTEYYPFKTIAAIKRELAKQR